MCVSGRRENSSNLELLPCSQCGASFKPLNVCCCVRLLVSNDGVNDKLSFDNVSIDRPDD